MIVANTGNTPSIVLVAKTHRGMSLLSTTKVYSYFFQRMLQMNAKLSDNVLSITDFMKA